MPIPPGFDPAAFFSMYTQKPFINELKVDCRTYYWLKSLKLGDVKAWRPCDKKWTKADQEKQFKEIQKFLRQGHVEESAEWVSVFERVQPSMSGFPARFYSMVAQLWRPIRANVLEHTADMDMSIAMQRSIRWVCLLFDKECGALTHYVEHRPEVLQKFMDDMGHTRERAKEAFQIPLTNSQPMRGVKNEFHKRYDAECKRIQQELMKVPELQWMLPHCKESNRAGSFISHLYQFIESKLLMAVASRAAAPVFGYIYDGLNLADKSLFDTQPPLDEARNICEEIAPGINMVWAWKPPDFTIRSKEKQEDIGELRVPDGFAVDRAAVAPRTAEEEMFDPETEPTYEELWERFSQTHKKVGSTYVDETKEEGRITLMDPRHFQGEYRHMVYFTLEDVLDKETGEVIGKKKVEKPFINKWMNDKRMDPIYLKDKSKRYYFKYFGMHPKPELCPPECYNNWQGFAVHGMPLVELAAKVKGATRTVGGLLAFLEHLKMLVSGNVDQYNFLLDLLAHTFQYPNVKPGIMMCLVGPQGSGKTMVWELIKRLIGKLASFETDQPQRDVWGDNNSKMIAAFFVRIMEADKKKFKGYIGEMRAKITDEDIRVRSLFCEAANVKSFARFFCDTNFADAIPDEHGERRFFIIYCSNARLGEDEYFATLKDFINDDACIRALYELLMRRKIKPMYLGKDIPVGDFQRKLKDANRGLTDSFVQHLVQTTDLCASFTKMSADELYKAYSAWQEGGNEYERSKGTILKELGLNAFGGITSKLERYKDEDSKEKVQTVYTFDLVALRKRYGLDELVEEMRLEKEAAKRDERARREAAAAEKTRAEGCQDIRNTFTPCPAGASSSSAPPVQKPCIDCKQDIRDAFPEVTLPFDAPEVEEEGVVVTEVGAMEEVPPSRAGAEDSEEDEALQGPPSFQARLKRRREESDDSITLRHGEIVAALPPTFKSAGVIPYNKDGFWLGLERRGGATGTWSDFGGKPEAGENAWEAAVRECKEEAGIDLSDVHLCRPPIFHPESAMQSVIFWVETDAVPVQGAHPNMVEYRQFQSWPEPLIGRLKYDQGSLLKKEMEELGFGGSKRKRCK